MSFFSEVKKPIRISRAEGTRSINPASVKAMDHSRGTTLALVATS